MQVVGADAVPNAFWEGPTEKIIERRNWERRGFERRKARGADDVPAALATTPAAWRKIVIGISLATFACGITVAMAFNRMQSRARAERIAAIDMGTLGGSPTPPAMERAGQSPAAPHAIER